MEKFLNTQKPNSSGHSPGRNILITTIIIAFFTGVFTGWLFEKEKPVPGKFLSEDIYLIGIGDSPSAGPETAPVTIVEFNDMTCRECNAVDNVLRKIVEHYTGEVKLVWKHSLIDESQEAIVIAQAGVAAGYAGKFWELKDSISATENKKDIKQLGLIAEELGLDKQKFENDLTREVYKRRVEVDLQTAKKLGVKNIPAVFINGRLIKGEITFERIKMAIDTLMPEAKKLIAGGTPPAQVYWEIVKKGKTSLEPPETQNILQSSSSSDASSNDEQNPTPIAY